MRGKTGATACFLEFHLVELLRGNNREKTKKIKEEKKKTIAAKRKGVAPERGGQSTISIADRSSGEARDPRRLFGNSLGAEVENAGRQTAKSMALGMRGDPISPAKFCSTSCEDLKLRLRFQLTSTAKETWKQREQAKPFSIFQVCSSQLNWLPSFRVCLSPCSSEDER